MFNYQNNDNQDILLFSTNNNSKAIKNFFVECISHPIYFLQRMDVTNNEPVHY